MGRRQALLHDIRSLKATKLASIVQQVELVKGPRQQLHMQKGGKEGASCAVLWVAIAAA